MGVTYVDQEKVHLESGEVPYVYETLSKRMTICAIGRRQYQPFVSRSDLHCAAKTGWKISEFWSCVATSLRNPVSPK